MTLVGSAMIASQINVPGLIITSNVQESRLQPQQHGDTVIVNDNYYENVTNLEEIQSVLINDWNLSSAEMLNSSSSSWLDSAKLSIDNNDSSYNLIDKFFKFDDYYNVHNGKDYNDNGHYYDKSDDIVKIMKMVRVSIENEKSNFENSLHDYFEKAKISTTSPTSLSTYNTAVTWVNNLFSVRS